MPLFYVYSIGKQMPLFMFIQLVNKCPYFMFIQLVNKCPYFMFIQLVNKCPYFITTQLLIVVFNTFRSLTPILRRVNIAPNLLSHATSILILFCCLFTNVFLRFADTFCRHSPFIHGHIDHTDFLFLLWSPERNGSSPSSETLIMSFLFSSLLSFPLSYAQIFSTNHTDSVNPASFRGRSVKEKGQDPNKKKQ